MGNLNFQRFHRFNLDKEINKRSRLPQSTFGYTLIEVLVVVAIIGVLATILGPGWLTFLNRQRVRKVNDAVFEALKEAQREAKRTKLSYSVSFKNENDIPKIAVHPATIAASTITDRWNTFALDLQPKQALLYSNIDTANKIAASSTVSDSAAPLVPGTEKTITFDYLGALAPRTDGNPADTGLKVVVATPKLGSNTPSGVRGCVIVQTLLGGIQIERGDKCI